MIANPADGRCRRFAVRCLMINAVRIILTEWADRAPSAGRSSRSSNRDPLLQCFEPVDDVRSCGARAALAVALVVGENDDEVRLPAGRSLSVAGQSAGHHSGARNHESSDPWKPARHSPTPSGNSLPLHLRITIHVQGSPEMPRTLELFAFALSRSTIWRAG